MSRNIPEDMKNKILARDGHTCRYCGNSRGTLHLDHVYPFSKGGETSFDNLVTSCSRCNLKKHASVGIWPKPVGHFQKKPVYSYRMIVIVLLAYLSFANGQAIVQDGFLLIGFVLLGVGVLLTGLMLALLVSGKI